MHMLPPPAPRSVAPEHRRADRPPPPAYAS